ncbi:MAG: hypothetical protein LBN98_00680 [Prevotellaceae bacterium]|jgi:hypothetical protein|nr:hypothetical protein [Prevotellaceae bacterium]
MKKNIYILFISLCSTVFAMAQTHEDALRYSQNIYEGTARFQGMGGAFAALGGDFTTLSINPAGVAVFRSSEFSITSTLALLSSSGTYLGNRTSESNPRVGIGNAGWVSSFYTNNTSGVVGFNFGIGFNKLQNNPQRFSAHGRTGETSLPRALAFGLDGLQHSAFENDATNTEWLAMKTGLIHYIDKKSDGTPIDGSYIGATEDFDAVNPDDLNKIYQMGDVNQSYYCNQTGHVGEYVFNFGLNVSHKFYFGMTFGLQDIANDFYEEYAEDAVNYADFNSTGYRGLVRESSIYTDGVGYNVKFGVIARPVGGLRVGAYIHTPTWMFLRNTWSEKMTSDINGAKSTESVEGHDDYRITTPARWGVGLAYTFGAAALLSVDYEGVNYTRTRLSNEHGATGIFQDNNNLLKQDCRTATNIRVGGEYKIGDFAVRAGYAWYQNARKDFSDTHIGSAGFGYRGRFFSADAAYSFAPGVKENYVIYNGNPDLTALDVFTGKFMVTIGFRF